MILGAEPSRARPYRAEGPTRPSTTVAIVDDHALVREGTVELLEHEPDLQVVGQAGSGEEALVLFERVGPDVALVDVNLPGMSGLELARRASERRLGVRVLVVSAYDDFAYVTEALELGVGGYLLKTATARELVDALRAVADGVFVLDQAVAARLARRQASGDARAGTPAALTSRELSVLAQLGRGRTNKQIAAALGLGVRTVEGYVSNVLVKLGVSSRTEAALYFRAQHRFVGQSDDAPSGPR